MLGNYPESRMVMKALVMDMETLNHEIYELDMVIREAVESDEHVSLVFTIPGLGYYGALGIASEIGEISRFSTEYDTFSYTGLVLRIHLSGNKEWKGHIANGNTFMKRLPVGRVQLHLMNCSNSSIKEVYDQITERSGSGKARIAAARHPLVAICCLLLRKQTYDEYVKQRMWR